MWAMKSIFNCSNDMALAANVRQYVPPKRVKQMEEDLAHLSRWWEGTRFAGPWGWSMAAKQRYRLMGVDEGALPSDMWLDRVRCLSSRSFACRYLVELLREMKCGKLLGDNMRFVALEDVADIGIGGWLSREGYDDLYPLIFKLPWSSSGRGVFVAKDMCDGVSRRVSGMLSSQGGVAVDKFYEGKLLDFAMEFFVDGDDVDFLGYSVFHAGDGGAYGFNYVESQTSLLDRIDVDAALLSKLVEYHIKHLRGIGYRGVVGVDMMKVLEDGVLKVHPCVEMNFRMNMGVLAMLLWDGLGETGVKNCFVELTERREDGFQAVVDDGKLMIGFNQNRSLLMEKNKRRSELCQHAIGCK